MILLLKAKDMLEAGLGWSEVLNFIKKLSVVEHDIKKKKVSKKNDIKDDISGMIPETANSSSTTSSSGLTSSTGRFMLASETTCCLPLATKPRWRRSFDSILYDGWRGN